MTRMLLAGLVLLFGSIAFGQDDPKVEVSVNYSYMRFVPQNNNIIQSFSLNGGGGGATFFLTKMIGIKAEFEGYGSQTRSCSAPLSNWTPQLGKIRASKQEATWVGNHA